MRLPLKSRIYYAAGRHLPFLKIRPPGIDRDATLTLRPGRNSLLTWEKRESGETILTIPINESARPLTRVLAKWLRAPTVQHKELDEVAGFVWELCDGDHTIDSIVQKLCRHYKMNRREAEVSVAQFLQTLHERKLIGFYKKTRSGKGDRPS